MHEGTLTGRINYCRRAAAQGYYWNYNHSLAIIDWVYNNIRFVTSTPKNIIGELTLWQLVWA